MNFLSSQVVKSLKKVRQIYVYLLSFNSFCRHGIFWIIKSMFLFSVIIWRDYFRLHTLRHRLPHLFCSLPDPGHMVTHLHHTYLYWDLKYQQLLISWSGSGSGGFINNSRYDRFDKKTNSHNPAHKLLILHSCNLTLFQPYILPILHPSNHTLLQSYTIPILHPSNLTLFQSHTLYHSTTLPL